MQIYTPVQYIKQLHSTRHYFESRNYKSFIYIYISSFKISIAKLVYFLNCLVTTEKADREDSKTKL